MATMIEKAQVTLPSDAEVMVTRSFKAPRSEERRVGKEC